MGGKGLSDLELLILRSIAHGKRIEDLAKAAKVPPPALGREIARLQLAGYIDDHGSLSEKGKKATEG